MRTLRAMFSNTPSFDGIVGWMTTVVVLMLLFAASGVAVMVMKS